MTHSDGTGTGGDTQPRHVRQAQGTTATRDVAQGHRPRARHSRDTARATPGGRGQGPSHVPSATAVTRPHRAKKGPLRPPRGAGGGDEVPKLPPRRGRGRGGRGRGVPPAPSRPSPRRAAGPGTAGGSATAAWGWLVAVPPRRGDGWWQCHRGGGGWGGPWPPPALREEPEAPRGAQPGTREAPARSGTVAQARCHGVTRCHTHIPGSVLSPPPRQGGAAPPPPAPFTSPRSMGGLMGSMGF